MFKELFKKMLISLAMMGGVVALSAPLPTYAQTVYDVCDGVALTGGNCDQTAGGADVEKLVQTVVNLLSLIVGIVAVIMIIIGGLKYITSSGDSSNVQSAKNTILYAIVGLVVVALAQVIVRFVLIKAS